MSQQCTSAEEGFGCGVVGSEACLLDCRILHRHKTHGSARKLLNVMERFFEGKSRPRENPDDGRGRGSVACLVERDIALF